MTVDPLSPRARRELLDAATWIAAENPASAEALIRAAIASAYRVLDRPGLARRRIDLSLNDYRFFAVRPFPYLLVFDVSRTPVRVARFVHQSRDLPTVLTAEE